MIVSGFPGWQNPGCASPEPLSGAIVATPLDRDVFRGVSRDNGNILRGLIWTCPQK